MRKDVDTDAFRYANADHRQDLPQPGIVDVAGSIAMEKHMVEEGTHDVMMLKVPQGTERLRQAPEMAREAGPAPIVEALPGPSNDPAPAEKNLPAEFILTASYTSSSSSSSSSCNIRVIVLTCVLGPLHFARALDLVARRLLVHDAVLMSVVAVKPQST